MSFRRRLWYLAWMAGVCPLFGLSVFLCGRSPRCLHRLEGWVCNRAYPE